jgi:hypothetical protein
MFNDRLLLGLKGTMSEAELHILRECLNGGIRNKAARGELRRGLPVGFVWGEKDDEVCFYPDESVRAAISNVFARFAELCSARRVWLYLRSEGLYVFETISSRKPVSHASTPNASICAKVTPARPHWREPAHRRGEECPRDKSCRKANRRGRWAPSSPCNRASSEGF